MSLLPTAPPAEGDLESPARDYEGACQQLRRRFPYLAVYPVVDPLESDEAPVMLADPIDDLADIIGDLREVLWSLETLGADDARWVFKFGYQTHWGADLHGVRGYLHALRFR